MAVPWLWHGAPAGITSNTDELDAVWRRREDVEPELDGPQLLADQLEAEPVNSRTPPPEVLEQPRQFVDKGVVKKCTSLDEVKAIVGDTFVVSDMIEVVKEKVDYHTMEVSTKHRLVLSLKKARISAATRLTHHSELPRATDAISDGLDLMADLQDDEEIEALIADVEDAFWQLSNRPDERNFFVAWIGGFYYIFLRTAQGSRNAGLTWAAIMGLLGRFANSLFAQPAFRRARSLEECRLHIYVDDPWAVARGTAARRQIIFAKLTALWLVVGLPIAFHKASRGQDVKWIGIQFTLQKGQIVCTIPADKLLELKSLTLAYTKKNIISKKDLRSFAGKMQSVASLLFALRPFVATLWAALYSPDGGCPQLYLDFTDLTLFVVVLGFLRDDRCWSYIPCLFALRSFEPWSAY